MGPRRWLAAAAILFAALWGWRELAIRAARERIASRDAEIRRLNTENGRLADQVARLNAEISTLAAPGTKVFTLTGPQDAWGRAFVNAQGQGLLVVDNLPATAADKSYQLWIIRSDQPKPQSTAVFDLTAPGSRTVPLEHLPPLAQIRGFNVTLEPKGGSAEPTGNTLALIAKPGNS